MIPHIVPCAEPRDAAEVLALARRVRAAMQARPAARWRAKREQVIERGRAADERLATVRAELRETRAALALERARADGLEVVVAQMRATILAAGMMLPGRQTSPLVLMVAEEFFGVTRLEICSIRRTAPLPQVRHMVCAALREFTILSLPQIGKALGDRDHTTVLHGVRRVCAGGAGYERYPDFRAACRAALAAADALPEGAP